LAEKIFHDILYCIKFVDDRLEWVTLIDFDRQIFQ
jgi:hypothetical protein